MATGPRPTAPPVWPTRPPPVRTGAGPERLDQPYRRLLSDTPHDRPPDERPGTAPAPVPGPVPDPRRGPMRAAIYARVSTERQERQQTIDSQLAALRAWAEAQGHSLVEQHVFRDEGYSGSPLDRPGPEGLRGPGPHAR